MGYRLELLSSFFSILYFILNVWIQYHSYINKTTFLCFYATCINLQVSVFLQVFLKASIKSCNTRTFRVMTQRSVTARTQSFTALKPLSQLLQQTPQWWPQHPPSISFPTCSLSAGNSQLFCKTSKKASAEKK